MTKLDLQKELLEKIKLGTKPSDIKKKLKKPSQTSQISSPVVQKDDGYQSDPERTILPKDDGYASDNSLISNETQKPIIAFNEYEREKPEPATNQPIKNLQNQISSLQKQLQVYKDFWAGDLKVKEKLKEENSTLKKTIQELKTSSKNTENSQGETSQLSTFTCSSCTRTFNIELIRLVKKSGKKICRNCTLLMLKRANQFTGQRIVLKIKNSPPTIQETFTCQTCQQPQTEKPHQVHITNFQEQGISPRQLTSICSPCLNEKVILANFYCLRTSEGRDTYDPKEPQFDCDCPTNQGGKHG